MQKGRGIKKRTKLIIIFIIVFLVMNSFLLVNSKFKDFSFSIKTQLPFSLSLSAIIFLLQWAILFGVGIIAYVRFIKHKKEEKTKIKVLNIKHAKLRSETDFDVLYDLIKKKKSLSTGIIAELFKIKKDNALGWAKILENSELVSIEYPAFGDPQVTLEGWDKDKKIQVKKEDGDLQKQNNEEMAEKKEEQKEREIPNKESKKADDKEKIHTKHTFKKEKKPKRKIKIPKPSKKHLEEQRIKKKKNILKRIKKVGKK